jgi:hypothetical protein
MILSFSYHAIGTSSYHKHYAVTYHIVKQILQFPYSDDGQYHPDGQPVGRPDLRLARPQDSLQIRGKEEAVFFIIGILGGLVLFTANIGSSVVFLVVQRKPR